MMIRIFVCAAAMALGAVQPAAAFPDRLLWGDTHVHTSYSPDAYFLFNRTTTPDSAFRFAKGLPVLHPYTEDRVRLERPLDFLVVSDHAEWLGGPRALFAGDERVANTPTGKRYLQMVAEGRTQDVCLLYTSDAADE